MRIAFFTDTFLPQVNGVATSIANFASELGRQGHQVLIVTPRQKKSLGHPWSAPNVEVLCLPSMPAFVYPDFRMSPFIGIPRVLRRIRAFRPDIIHFHTTLMISIDALIAAKLFRVPLVGTYHIYLTKKTTDYLHFISKNPHVLRWITRFVLSYSLALYAFCDLRLTPSQLLIDELRQGGYKRSLICLPNAVPRQDAVPLNTDDKELLRKRYGLRSQVVLHVGRLSAEKEAGHILDMFLLIRKERENVSLLIVGDGPDRNNLEKQVHEKGLDDAVVFTGFIPPAELYASGLFQLADVFVTASPMESQGMVIVEAMSFGVPVVAVGEAAVPEVVGESGILVAKDDSQAMARAVTSILENPELAADLRHRSLKRAELFSLPVLTEKLIGLYCAVIASRKPAKHS